MHTNCGHITGCSRLVEGPYGRGTIVYYVIVTRILQILCYASPIPVKQRIFSFHTLTLVEYTSENDLGLW